jgi:hypothetical protein
VIFGADVELFCGGFRRAALGGSGAPARSGASGRASRAAVEDESQATFSRFCWRAYAGYSYAVPETDHRCLTQIAHAADACGGTAKAASETLSAAYSITGQRAGLEKESLNSSRDGDWRRIALRQGVRLVIYNYAQA